MITVTELARQYSLSRGTLLYYESIGLLKPPARTAGNYRAYGEEDLRRLEQICIYRKAGLKLADIRDLLDRPGGGSAAEVLERRLGEIDVEIERLREHQRAIFKLLRSKKPFGRIDMVTKEKWVGVMKAAGFTEEDMKRWHAEFERSAPDEHQEFLEFLHIPAEDIRKIREWSKQHAG
jgi:MerR family transcriptional regulator, thiopeptide resistance regulator